MEIFSGVGLKRGAGGGGSVTLSSEILARAANMFPNTSTEGKIFPILVLLTVDHRGRIRWKWW